MKTTRIFNRVFFACPLLAALLLTVSCDKDNDDNMNNDTTYTISGDASGAQENPAVTTSATATLTGTYNASTNQLSYTINWTELSDAATTAHFHGPAAAGTNADVLIPLTIVTNGAAGQATDTITIADSTENYLLNGNVYYNIHTLLHPDGEIRGQVVATAN